MSWKLWIMAAGVGGLLALAAPRAGGAEAPAAGGGGPPKELMGPWEHTGAEKGFVLLEADRCTLASGGHALVGRVLAWQAGGMSVRVYGARKSYELEVKDGVLAMTEVGGGKRGETRRFRRLEAVPPELIVRPMEFGKAGAVAPDRVKALREEFQRRQAEDQAVRKDPARRAEMAKIDADNTAWLRRQVIELGWIDAGRFGAQASDAAFLLVQHSMDLPLMTAALPEIEKDVKAKKLDGQAFALLYDRTRLMLGERQRYGTQVGQDARGEPVVLPLEDRARVEEFRKEIGIFPLSQYLEMMKQMTGGKEVKFAEEE